MRKAEESGLQVVTLGTVPFPALLHPQRWCGCERVPVYVRVHEHTHLLLSFLSTLSQIPLWCLRPPHPFDTSHEAPVFIARI